MIKQDYRSISYQIRVVLHQAHLIADCLLDTVGSYMDPLVFLFICLGVVFLIVFLFSKKDSSSDQYESNITRDETQKNPIKSDETKTAGSSAQNDVKHPVTPFPLRIGQKLFCSNGEEVIVRSILANSFEIEIKNKTYTCSFAMLGKYYFDKPLINETPKVEHHPETKVLTPSKPLTYEQLETERLPRVRQEISLSDTQQFERERREKKVFEESRKKVTQLENIRKTTDSSENRNLSRAPIEHNVVKQVTQHKGTSTNHASTSPNIPAEARFFHEVFGEGTLKRIDDANGYIYITFQNDNKIRRFQYPVSIGEHIFLQKTNKMQVRDSLFQDPNHCVADDVERQYFERVMNVTKQELRKASFDEEVSQSLSLIHI